MRRERTANAMPAEGTALFLSLFLLDALVYFFSVHGYFTWSLDSNPDLVAAHTKHGDIDIITDLQCFSIFSGKYQHGGFSPGGRAYCQTRSIRSVSMLCCRRSGIFLRHSLIVAPLLSLNGTRGITLSCRLSFCGFLWVFIVSLGRVHINTTIEGWCLKLT